MSAVNSTFSEDFAQNRVTGVVSKVLVLFHLRYIYLYGRHKHNEYLSVVQLIVNGVNGPLVSVPKDVEKGLGQKLEKE